MSTILLLYYSSQSFTDISFFIACQQRLSGRASQQVLLHRLVVEVPGVVMLSIVPTPKVEGVNYLGGWDK